MSFTVQILKLVDIKIVEKDKIDIPSTSNLACTISARFTIVLRCINLSYMFLSMHNSTNALCTVPELGQMRPCAS
jgi:hypothetical protein